MQNENTVAAAAPGEGEESIVVEEPAVRIVRPLTIVAEAAAKVLAITPPNKRAAVFAHLLNVGAGADTLYSSSVIGQLWERQMTGMYQGFVTEMQSEFKAGGENVEEQMLRLLQRHERDLFAWATKLTDPTNDQGIPKIAADQMRKVTDLAIAQLNVILTEGDNSALGKWSDRILKQLAQLERNLLAQIVHKNAVASVGIGRGRDYEADISVKLSRIAPVMGCQVDRCSDHLGVKRSKHGDHLITLDPAITGGVIVRMVVEAKSRAEGQRFSHQAIQKECEYARANREASAAVFVAEAREILPDGIGFGQIGRTDFFVEYDPDTGDDLGLTAAIHLARVASLQDLKPAGPGPVDRLAAHRLVAEIRDRIERRSRIQTYHASATKAIYGAAKALDEDTEAILSSLMKLDGLLVA
jgi:hypothetical protein